MEVREKFIMYDFYKSFQQKSPIYYEVFLYLETQVVELKEKCMKIRDKFMNYELDLEEEYLRVASKAKAGMNIAQGMWKELEATKEKSDFSDLAYLVRLNVLIKYIYIDVQTELLCFNAVLNKVFFEEKIQELLQEVYDKEGIDHLDFLTALDQATSYQYIKRRENATAEKMTNLLEKFTDLELAERVKKVVEEFSIQKKSEHMFSEAFIEWTPLVLPIREEIWRVLKKVDMYPEDEMRVLPFYNLLPYVEKVVLPNLYENATSTYFKEKYRRE